MAVSILFPYPDSAPKPWGCNRRKKNIQNLSLSLVANDVGCKWSTGKITKDINTYKIAEIDANDEEIIGFIWIGYGTEPPLIKRPLISTIYRERN